MKAPQENTQEAQKETIQCVQRESSTGGEATIVDNRFTTVAQRKLKSAMGGTEDNNNPIQRKTNNTGLPDNLKSGIENLSGYRMDDVKVHYNSSKPAQLQAHAYAQGTDIHLARGQEKHLPHEAWHVVQQKQGRVKPTKQLKSKVNINDDAGLEKEADLMGQKAVYSANVNMTKKINNESEKSFDTIVQLKYILPSIYYQIKSKFLRRLKLLKSEQTFEQTENGAFIGDLIPYHMIIHNQHEDIVKAFRCYITGETPEDYLINALLELLTPDLDKVYGKSELKRIMKKKKFDRGWYHQIDNPGGLKFNTNGLAFNYDAYNSSKVRKLKTKMLNQVISQEKVLKKDSELDSFAEKRARKRFHESSYDEWTLSGDALPVPIEIAPNEVFYKIMGPGKNFMKSFSVYYLDQQTYDYIKTSGSFMDLLGLPALSYEAVYAVYKIKARVKTDVFKSKIASAQSTGGRRESGQYTKIHPGGLTQTLIVNSNNPDVWEKIATPYEILDPDEQAVESLQKTVYTPPR
ncbi:DUF4157 domain-containing protein [uncultured Aquimarina sp.]|uniref:eCIS core domain-containing protein n=1 Tax=uncultured Aquimarina sp. TaxID=575652 RepID=UPI002633468F|nr:DUF4157 domain-containing protein [uncultured Aquimarina sp.]